MATALTKKSASQPGLVQLLTLVFLIVWLVLLPACNHAHNSPTNSLKAAIIDQLYVLQPNQDFIEQTTQELEDYGFEVDLYQGDEVWDHHMRFPTRYEELQPG